MSPWKQRKLPYMPTQVRALFQFIVNCETMNCGASEADFNFYVVQAMGNEFISCQFQIIANSGCHHRFLDLVVLCTDQKMGIGEAHCAQKKMQKCCWNENDHNKNRNKNNKSQKNCLALSSFILVVHGRYRIAYATYSKVGVFLFEFDVFHEVSLIKKMRWARW